MNKSQIETLRLKDYVLGPQIGKGTFGTVFQCTNLESGITAAVKITDMKVLKMRSPVNEAKILREVRIMRELAHPNIVQFIDSFLVKDVLYLVIELVLGIDLFETIVSRDGVDEQGSKFLFYQLMSALSYLHSRGIMHRDVKPENVLLSSNAPIRPPPRRRRLGKDAGLMGEDELAEREAVLFGNNGGGVEKLTMRNRLDGGFDDDDHEEEEEHDYLDDDEEEDRDSRTQRRNTNTGSIPRTTRIKLIDFGLSKLNDDMDMSVVGTPRYIAPEILRLANRRPLSGGGGVTLDNNHNASQQMEAAYDFGADCYSAGIVLFVMLSARFPCFEVDEEDEHRITASVPHQTSSEEVPTRVAFDSSDEVNVTRISPVARDLIWKLTHFDPKRRISANEALLHPFLREMKPLCDSHHARRGEGQRRRATNGGNSNNYYGGEAIVPFQGNNHQIILPNGVTSGGGSASTTTSSTSSSNSNATNMTAAVMGVVKQQQPPHHHHHHPFHHHQGGPHGTKRKFSFDNKMHPAAFEELPTTAPSPAFFGEEIVRELGPVTIVPSFASSALVQAMNEDMATTTSSQPPPSSSSSSSGNSTAASVHHHQNVTIKDMLQIPAAFERNFLSAMREWDRDHRPGSTNTTTKAKEDLVSIWNASKDLFAQCDKTLIHIGNTASLVLRSLSDVRLAVEEGEVDLLHVNLKLISGWIAVLYGEIDAVLRSNRLIDDALTRFVALVAMPGEVSSSSSRTEVSVMPDGDSPTTISDDVGDNNNNNIGSVTDSIAQLSLAHPPSSSSPPPKMTTSTVTSGDYRHAAPGEYTRRMTHLLRRHLAFWIKLEAFITYISEQTKYIDESANQMRNPNRLRERFLMRMEEFLNLWRQIVSLSEQFHVQLYQIDRREAMTLATSTTTGGVHPSPSPLPSAASTSSSSTSTKYPHHLGTTTTSPTSRPPAMVEYWGPNGDEGHDEQNNIGNTNSSSTIRNQNEMAVEISMEESDEERHQDVML